MALGHSFAVGAMPASPAPCAPTLCLRKRTPQNHLLFAGHRASIREKGV